MRQGGFMITSKQTFPIRDGVVRLRISPDAKHWAIYQNGGYSKNTLTIYGADADNEVSFLRTVSPREEAKGSLAPIFDISPNGRYLAVCTHERPFGMPVDSDGMACNIFDLVAKVYLPSFIHQEISGKTNISGGFIEDFFMGYDYLDVRFLPDNERFITVTTAGEIFVWSVLQQKLLWSISAAAHLTYSVAFSHKFGLFAMSDNQSKEWKYGQIGQHTTSFDKILYQQYGKWVASEPLNLGYSFRLWNTYSGSLIREFDADYAVDDLVFSRDDKRIAGSMNQTAFIWDVNTGEVVDALPENTKPFAFTSNDQYLITIHEGSSIALWDVQTKQWHQHYKLDGLISSAQLSQNDIVVALSKTINEWQLHQIQLDDL
jgi:hypothetical protein